MRIAENIISEAREAGFVVETMVAKIKEGFSFHEKAIFCIKNGILKVYSIETLEEEQEERIAKCITTEELEKTIKEMNIRTGQPVYIMDGNYIDDNFLINIKDKNVELYMISPAEKK